MSTQEALAGSTPGRSSSWEKEAERPEDRYKAEYLERKAGTKTLYELKSSGTFLDIYRRSALSTGSEKESTAFFFLVGFLFLKTRTQTETTAIKIKYTIGKY